MKLQQEADAEHATIVEEEQVQSHNIHLAATIIQEEEEKRNAVLLTTYEHNEQIDFLLQQSNEPF